MKEKNLGTLRSNMDNLISGLGVFGAFELKGNFTDSTVWDTGKAGDIYSMLNKNSQLQHFFASYLFDLRPFWASTKRLYRGGLNTKHWNTEHKNKMATILFRFLIVPTFGKPNFWLAKNFFTNK